MLQGKKILLGITGSIAAYKAAYLCRLLMKEGCQVKVIMTPSACNFITPLSLSTLSSNDVCTEISDGKTWNNHVELGLWADAMIIAPATASTISKMANGLSDNMLLAVYLSSRCPVFIAPAMDFDMWKHPSTVANIKKLIRFGNHILPVGFGFLASGLEGEGRMAEPEVIVDNLKSFFQIQHDLRGKNVLITAGPTVENIDPVRFISNRSSGKMGYAIAEECLARGAKVTLVSGPVNLSLSADNLKTIHVQTADEMLEACLENSESSDIIILCAAVSDYKPVNFSSEKIKKSDDKLDISLVKNVDIAACLGQKKHSNQILVGFALETNDEISNAKHKLHKKNLDFIVLNSLKDADAGFAYDTNKITIIDKWGKEHPFELKSKKEVATDIINFMIKIQDKVEHA